MSCKAGLLEGFGEKLSKLAPGRNLYLNRNISGFYRGDYTLDGNNNWLSPGTLFATSRVFNTPLTSPANYKNSGGWNHYRNGGKTSSSSIVKVMTSGDVQWSKPMEYIINFNIEPTEGESEEDVRIREYILKNRVPYPKEKVY